MLGIQYDNTITAEVAAEVFSEIKNDYPHMDGDFFATRENHYPTRDWTLAMNLDDCHELGSIYIYEMGA